jgi:hypothetical protein
MKWLLYGSVCLFAIGCGTAATDDTQNTDGIPVGDVSKVTDEIRNACSSLNLTDDKLASLIAAAESDRDGGISRDDAVTGIVNACSQSPDKAVPCEECLRAIIDLVYGPA